MSHTPCHGSGLLFSSSSSGAPRPAERPAALSMFLVISRRVCAAARPPLSAGSFSGLPSSGELREARHLQASPTRTNKHKQSWVSISKGALQGAPSSTSNLNLHRQGMNLGTDRRRQPRKQDGAYSTQNTCYRAREKSLAKLEYLSCPCYFREYIHMGSEPLISNWSGKKKAEYRTWVTLLYQPDISELSR